MSKLLVFSWLVDVAVVDDSSVLGLVLTLVNDCVESFGSSSITIVSKEFVFVFDVVEGEALFVDWINLPFLSKGLILVGDVLGITGIVGYDGFVIFNGRDVDIPGFELINGIGFEGKFTNGFWIEFWFGGIIIFKFGCVAVTGRIKFCRSGIFEGVNEFGILLGTFETKFGIEPFWIIKFGFVTAWFKRYCDGLGTNGDWIMDEGFSGLIPWLIFSGITVLKFWILFMTILLYEEEFKIFWFLLLIGTLDTGKIGLIAEFVLSLDTLDNDVLTGTIDLLLLGNEFEWLGLEMVDRVDDDMELIFEVLLVLGDDIGVNVFVEGKFMVLDVVLDWSGLDVFRVTFEWSSELAKTEDIKLATNCG